MFRPSKSKDNGPRVGKLAQWVKELATKPADLSSIFGIHMVKLTTKSYPIMSYHAYILQTQNR